MKNSLLGVTAITKFILVFIFLSLASIPNSNAFDTGANIPVNGPNGACFVAIWDAANITYPGEHNTARVVLSNYTEQAGGLGWRFNVLATEGAPDSLSAAGIESHCGYHDVTIISQMGADAASFSAEDYIGVRFNARESANTALNEYEVAISGVTNTVLVNTKVSLATANTISFPAISDIQFGHFSGEPLGSRNSVVLTSTDVATLGLGVTATAGSPDFSASGPCEISNYFANLPYGTVRRVLATGVGDCTVTATHAGDVNHAAAAPVSQTFTISKGDQTISYNTGISANQNYTENGTFAISAVAITNGYAHYSSGVESGSRLMVSYTSATTDICSIGSSTLTNYYAGGGYTFYYSTADVTMLKPGTCTITGSQAGDANFNAASDLDRSFSIIGPVVVASQDVAGTLLTNGTVVTAFSPVTATGGYGDLSYAVSPTLPAGLSYNTTNGEITGTPTAVTGSVQYTVTVTDEGGATDGETFALQVQKGVGTLQIATIANKTFSGDLVAVSATATGSTGALTYESLTSGICTVSGTNATMVTTGTCTIRVSQAADANYNSPPTSEASFDIGTADQALSFTAPANQIFVASGTVGLTATAGVSTSPVTYASTTTGICTVSGSTVTMVTAGTCSITASQAADANYNAAPDVVDTFDIGKANQTLSFTAPANQIFVASGTVGLTATAGASTSPVTYASTTTGICTVSGSTVTMVTAGTCSITASQAADANYNAAPDVVDTFDIGKANQSIQASAVSNRIIVAQTTTLSATSGAGTGATTFAITNGSSFCSISGATITGTGVGACEVTATKAQDTNYNQAVSSISIAVGKANATIILESDNSNPQQGETVNYTATITSPVAVTGTVDFYNDNDSICVAQPVSATSATCSFAFTVAGTQNVTAQYNGDASNSTADSNALTPEVINTVVETQKTILQFVQNRSTHVLNNQPSLIKQTTGQNNQGQGRFGLLQINGNEHAQKIYFSTSRSKILNAKKFHSSLNPSTATYALGVTQTNSEISSGGNILGFKQTDNKAKGNSLNLEGSEKEVTQNSSRTGTWDVWTEIYGSRSNVEQSNSSLWVGYVGLHYFVDDQNAIGLIGQLDWSEETDSATGSKADGRGWLVGPYIAGKINDNALYYEASIRYGRSQNNVTPIGTYTDKFETDRLMVSGKLTGEYKKDGILVNPEVGLTWYEETQKAYTDSLNNVIPKQVVSFGELRFGPTFSKGMKLENGAVFLSKIGVNGVYNFDTNNNSAQGAGPVTDELRARLSLGFSTTDPLSGVTLSGEGFYDGIGISNFESYGGRAKVLIPIR